MISPEYLAGFFDGEGTFYLGFQKSKNPESDKLYPKAQVLLSQSGFDGKELLEKIREEYGGTLYQHLEAGEHKATKPAYKVYWNKLEAVQLITKLLPYLILKKDKAEEVLTYLLRNNDETTILQD